MSKVKAEYMQECDLCHRMIKTNAYGLKWFTLPYATERSVFQCCVTLSVCSECIKRLGRVMDNCIDFTVRTTNMGEMKDFTAKWKENEKE